MFIIRILFIFSLILGACTSAHSQTYNEYAVWFGNERKVGKKIVFDTILNKMILTVQSSTIALETANKLALDYNLRARIKFIRRLENNEPKQIRLKIN